MLTFIAGIFSVEYFHERVQAEIEAAGKHAPSVASLKRYAAAVGCTLKIKLIPTVSNQAFERPHRIKSRQAAQLEHSASREIRIDSDRSRGMLRLNGFVAEGRPVA